MLRRAGSVLAPGRRRLGSFNHGDLRVDALPSPKSSRPSMWEASRVPPATDHMLEVDFSGPSGWGAPLIRPLQPLHLAPTAKVLHYASALFESLTAVHGVDGEVRLFRPHLSMCRMVSSAKRAVLPTFDPSELLRCLDELLSVDRAWVPKKDGWSLLIRALMISTDPNIGIGPSESAKIVVFLAPRPPPLSPPRPLALYANPSFACATRGGTAKINMSCNYAGTFHVADVAKAAGCSSVLWLNGRRLGGIDDQNVFVVFRSTAGGVVVVTPGLESGLVRAGLTRQSVLELAAEAGDVAVEERHVTMDELVAAEKDGRLLEVFGTGTEAGIRPAASILFQAFPAFRPLKLALNAHYDGSYAQRFARQLDDIHRGRVSRERWTRLPLHQSKLSPQAYPGAE